MRLDKRLPESHIENMNKRRISDQEVSVKTLAERLSEVVNVLGSKSALARLIGASPSDVSRWTAGGERVPTTKMIYRICQATGISSDYLLGLSNIKATHLEDVEKYDLVLCIKSVNEFTQHRDVLLRAGKSIRVGCSNGKGGG